MARGARNLPGPLPAAPMAAPVPASLGTVEMQSPTGESSIVPVEQAGTLAGLGYRQVTPELLGQQAEKKEYGEGIVNELEAAGLGILRGSTLGLSDLALRQIKPEWADSAAKLKQYNPDASLSGEIGSFLIPAVGAIKGLGAAGKAAQATGLLQGLVSEGAGSLGKIATKIIGDNLAGHAAGAAIKLGTEAAVYQAAHNLSEASLGDHELTAESILANVGSSAILGAGIGGALPVVARGTQELAKAAMRVEPIRAAVNSAARTLSNFFDRDHSLQMYAGAQGRSELIRDTMKGEKFKSSVSGLGDKGLFKGGDVVPDVTTGGFTQSAKGMLPNREAALARVENGIETFDNAVTDILADVDKAIGQDSISLSDPVWKAAHPGRVKELYKFQDEFKKIVSQIDGKAEAALRRKIYDFVANGEATSAEPMLDELARVKQLMADKGGSLAGLQDLKQGLYRRIKSAGYEQVGTPMDQTLKDLARLVKENIDFGVELVKNEPAYRGLAASMAPVSKLNETIGQLLTIKEPLDRAMQKANANMNVGGFRLRDAFAGATGAAIGGPLLGGAAALANKFAQSDVGYLARAELGAKLQNLAWAQKLTEAGQKDIAGAIAGFLGKTDAGAAASKSIQKISGPVAYAMTSDRSAPKRASDQQAWFDETRKQILNVAGNPEAFAQNQGSQLQPLADHAPNVSSLVLQKQLQVYDYLAKVMPKNPGMPLSLFNDPWKPADYQVQDFRRVVQVARSPLSLLEDMRKGTATNAQVAAVRELYPKIYESILTQVQAGLNAPDTKVSYSQQLKLGQLFPGSIPSMQPAFVAAMQAPVNKPKENAAPHPPSGSVTFGNRRASASDRTEAR